MFAKHLLSSTLLSASLVAGFTPTRSIRSAQSPDKPSDKNSNNNNNKAWIAGVIAGPLLGIAIGALVAFLILRYRRRRRKSNKDTHPDPDAPPDYSSSSPMIYQKSEMPTYAHEHPGWDAPAPAELSAGEEAHMYMNQRQELDGQQIHRGSSAMIRPYLGSGPGYNYEQKTGRDMYKYVVRAETAADKSELEGSYPRQVQGQGRGQHQLPLQIQLQELPASQRPRISILPPTRIRNARM